jgi:hypothetical protein
MTTRSNALMVITVIVVSWKCLFPAITFVSISGLIISTHAIMRDPKQIDAGPSNESHEKDSDNEGDSSESEVLVERGDVI